MNNSDVWDAVIVGAGPAGGVTAALLAGRGWRVLLVEKSDWPRDKVCGGCLSASAVAVIKNAGLGNPLANSQRIDHASWQVGRQSLCLDTPGGAAILRRDFDSALVNLAVARGCIFMSRSSAQLQPRDGGEYRTVRLKTPVDQETIRTRLVLACDGINGTLLANESWASWRFARRPWMGVSTTCSEWPSGLGRGTIHMHVGRGGYVGLVRLTTGEVHLAAALNPTACQHEGGPGLLVESILNSCDQATCIGLADSKFRGSGALTRRRGCLGGHRVLAIGDACGYVEPFTGEGMAWAIAGAIQAVEMLPQPQATWPVDLPERWLQHFALAIGAGQRRCAALKPLVHHPLATMAAITLGNALPSLAARLVPSLEGAMG